MRSPVHLLAIVGAALMVSGLAGCAPAEAPPKPEALSPSQAGAAYLAAVCPVNRAWDTADVALDRLRLAAERVAADAASAKKPDSKLVEAERDDAVAFATSMREVSKQSEAAAEALRDDGRTWPREAEAAVAEVARTLDADRKQADRVAQLKPAAALTYTWEGADAVGAASAAARTALGLPDDADRACAQWAAAAQDAAASDADADAADTDTATGTGGTDSAHSTTDSAKSATDTDSEGRATRAP